MLAKGLLRKNMLNNIRNFSLGNACKSSYNDGINRKTLIDIQRLYKSNQVISMVTSHDYITSKLAEKSKIDINLIGDSLAMTTLGYKDTNELTLDEFLYHVKSVERGNKSSFLVADMPFGSFEVSIKQAVETAIKLVKSGKVQGIKIEGGNKEILPTIERVISIGIPVMGHVGLTPQKHNAFGGFKLQGNVVEDAVKIYQECLNLQKIGCFAIVLECIPNKLANFITTNLSIPTIGIGAGPNCSGQVLVIGDLLGMSNPEETYKPKFVKSYFNFFEHGIEALNNYKNDLESRQFPKEDKHGYKMKKEVFEEFQNQIKNL